MKKWVIFFVVFFIGSLSAQERAVVYFYQADRVKNMSGADTIMVEHITTNVINLLKKYQLVTRETITNYLQERGITNQFADIPPALVIANAIKWGFSDVVEVTFSQGQKIRTFVITLRIWNVVEKGYTKEQKISAMSGRDIFEALDTLSLVLAEGLTGRRLGFGTLRVFTTLSNATIFVDGIEYETSSLTVEKILAGLVHTVFIGQKRDGTFFPLYTNSFEIQEGFVYDVTYYHEERVEIVDLRVHTKRTLQQEENTFSFGPALRFGMGNFFWIGGYGAWQSSMLDFSVGYTPQFVAEKYGVYMHTIGLQSFFRLRLFDRDESLWNMGVALGLTRYLGVWPSFVWYNNGWPLFTGEITLSLQWRVSWVPTWLRSLETEVSVGTMVLRNEFLPMLGITVRY